MKLVDERTYEVSTFWQGTSFSLCVMLTLAVVGWNMGIVVAEEEGVCTGVNAPGWCDIVGKLKDGNTLNNLDLLQLQKDLKGEYNSFSESGGSSAILSELLNGNTFTLKNLDAKDIDSLAFEDVEGGGCIMKMNVRGKDVAINVGEATIPDGVTGIEVNGEEGVRYVFKDSSGATNSDGTVKQSVLRIKDSGSYPVKDENGKTVLKGFVSRDGKVLGDSDLIVDLGEERASGHIVVDGSDLQIKGTASATFAERKIEVTDSSDSQNNGHVEILDSENILAKSGIRVNEGDKGYFDSNVEDGVFVGDLQNIPDEYKGRALQLDGSVLKGDLSGMKEGESVDFTKSVSDDVTLEVDGVTGGDITLNSEKNSVTLTKRGDKVEVRTSAQEAGVASTSTSGGKTTKRAGSPILPILDTSTSEGSGDGSGNDDGGAGDGSGNGGNGGFGGSGFGGGGGGSGGGDGLLSGLFSNPLLLLLLGGGLLAFLAFSNKDKNKDKGNAAGCVEGNETSGENCGAGYNDGTDSSTGQSSDSSGSSLTASTSPEQDGNPGCVCDETGCHDCGNLAEEPVVQGGSSTGQNSSS